MLANDDNEIFLGGLLDDDENGADQADEFVDEQDGLLDDDGSAFSTASLSSAREPYIYGNPGVRPCDDVTVETVQQGSQNQVIVPMIVFC